MLTVISSETLLDISPDFETGSDRAPQKSSRIPPGVWLGVLPGILQGCLQGLFQGFLQEYLYGDFFRIRKVCLEKFFQECLQWFLLEFL